MTFQFQRQSQQIIPINDVKAPTGEDRYSDWEIESLIGLLYDKAIEIGEQHSQAHFSRTGKYAPLAYQASTGFKMLEIVRQLQQEITEKQTEIDRLNAVIKDAGVWEKKPVKRVKKSEPTPE
jgi:hypothetical protein